jgi:hypothetical protein
MFSMAVTWLALSPSNLPAAVIRVTPSASASFCAPSFILTKNGLVSVLVISPTLTLSVEPEPDDELDLPQAASPSEAPTSTATTSVDVDFHDMNSLLRPPARQAAGARGCVNVGACQR